MNTGNLEYIIEALSDPEIYPHEPGSVEIRQTHASIAFLAGDEVYKLKKPVDFGFLNYSTPELRREMCEREVALNRRLAAPVYRGVVELVERNGRLHLGGNGQVVDYLVHMRRLNDGDSLASRLEHGLADSGQMLAVAHKIASFHSQAARSPVIDRFGSAETVAANVDENFDQTLDFIGTAIHQVQYSEIVGFAHRFMNEQQAVFAARIGAGRICDGHGDLRADHVYFDDGIQIIDCIEFNNRLRYGDVAVDIGFLLMDLDAYGFPDLADALLAEYARTSGDDLRQVVDFYRCYRAYVRGKVLSFETAAPELAQEQRQRAMLDARRYFHLAHRYARSQRGPRLIIMCGLTGAGKSTTAKPLKEALPAFMFDSDTTRKRLAGVPPSSRHETPPDTGIYSPEMSKCVYAALLQEAEHHLSLGRTVLLDAAFLRRADRLNAKALASRHGASFLAIECRAPENVARERLRKRVEDVDRVSDGRWEIYLAQRESFEPLDELSRSENIALDTTQDIFKQIDQILLCV